MKSKKMRVLSATVAMAAVLSSGMTFSSPSASADDARLYASSADEKILCGAVYTLENVNSGKLVGIDGENIVHQTATAAVTQQWRITSVGEGYVKFISDDDYGKVLTVQDDNVVLATHSPTQQFKIMQKDNVYYVTARSSDDTMALDITKKSVQDGANVGIYKYKASDNQLFKIVPVDNTYTFIRGDMTGDGKIDTFDLTLMRRAYLQGFGELEANIADLTADGKADIDDVKMLQDYLLGKIESFGETYYTMPYTEPEDPVTPDVPVNTNGRQMEYLDRGVVTVSTGKEVFVSWRSLATDADGTGFNLYRTTDGNTIKVNDGVITGGTNYTDATADLSKANTYTVKAVINGKEADTDGDYTIPANSTAECIEIPIKSGGTIHFVWVGDFNGDGKYDFLLDRPDDDHQKLEAYLNDGTYLWTIDLGVNSENHNNISPGASTIDVGMWDGATVYDIDCDGYAEVLVRIADGVTMGDGTVYKNNTINGQAIAVVNGMTGALKTSASVPDDYINIGPMACMMEVGYLDGKKPSLVCWFKNRNANKTFNSLDVAYTFENGEFKQQWKYENKTGYAEAHQIRVADVDYDGKDEVLHMGYALNGDGTLRYHIDDIVHGDRWYVGAFENGNYGNAMMGYGIQRVNPSGLLEYFYNASTGEILWENKTTDGSTFDVARGNVGDIDPNYDGFECWSFQGTFNYNGTHITDNYLYPVIRLWWDGDLLSESYNDGKLEKWDYKNNATQHILTTWKVTDCTGSNRGAPMFYGDILGDWREEVIMTNSDYSKLVILTTTKETDERIYCLAQNPCYRNCMTAKGYYQSHMLDYFLGYNMEKPKTPDITIIEK